jgi:hypothetical protein
MLRLRFYIIALLLFTGIALNIERLDFGPQEDIVNLASFVYGLLGASVMTTVLIPSKWKIPANYIIVFWSAVYFAFKVILINDRPIVGGLYTYLTIAELFILIGLIVLTQKVMEYLNVLEDTVADITMADVSSRVKNLDTASPDIDLEFIRSRRYKRSLGLIVVRLKPENVQAYINDLSKDILRTMMSRYSMSKLIRAIDKHSRRTDLILEQRKENRVILLLPESDLEATQAVYTNIQRIAQEGFGSMIDMGSATFPDDAITFDALVSFAENNIRELAHNNAVENDIPDATQD